MGTQLVTRKFFNEEDNNYVAVKSNVDSDSCYVEFTLADQSNIVYYGFLLLDGEDMLDEYNKAVNTLTDIIFAANAALDELMDSYTQINLSANSMNEDPPWEDR